MSKIRLFCLPYAGSSAMVYYQWSKYLDKRIDIHPVELAGRGSRIDVPFYDSISDAAEDVCCSIKKYIEDTPYAIFGHSMGSWIAFELYHELIKSGLRKPEHIFFSGNRAPHLNNKRNKIIYNLPENEFKEEILKLGGTPREIFEDNALASIFIPLIRADYKITENYLYTAGKNKLECGVSVLCGRDDEITREGINEWGEHVINGCEIVYFDGGHFFLHHNVAGITDIINQTLRKSLC
jgi:medium-chain acyl-[acyl-carrier-protein] hydrolase